VIEPSPTSTAAQRPAQRVGSALGRRSNWEQLGKFCVVGLSGYAVNLVVYALLLRWAGLHYIPAAVGSFLVAVANNYTWNRVWTFRGQRGNVAYQGLRFLVVSTTALAGNLVVLYLLVKAGLGALPAQAIAIVLVTPLNFVGNKLWSFRRR
jgi:dolichol-phosphate mannosyltransferase